MNVYPANNQRLAGRTQKCVYKKKSDNGQAKYTASAKHHAAAGVASAPRIAITGDEQQSTATNNHPQEAGTGWAKPLHHTTFLNI